MSLRVWRRYRAAADPARGIGNHAGGGNDPWFGFGLRQPRQQGRSRKQRKQVTACQHEGPMFVMGDTYENHSQCQ